MKQMTLPRKKTRRENQLRLVSTVYPIIYKVLYIPGGTPKTGRVYPEIRPSGSPVWGRASKKQLEKSTPLDNQDTVEGKKSCTTWDA